MARRTAGIPKTVRDYERLKLQKMLVTLGVMALVVASLGGLGFYIHTVFGTAMVGYSLIALLVVAVWLLASWHNDRTQRNYGRMIADTMLHLKGAINASVREDAKTDGYLQRQMINVQAKDADRHNRTQHQLEAKETQWGEWEDESNQYVDGVDFQVIDVE